MAEQNWKDQVAEIEKLAEFGKNVLEMARAAKLVPTKAKRVVVYKNKIVVRAPRRTKKQIAEAAVSELLKTTVEQAS